MLERKKLTSLADWMSVEVRNVNIDIVRITTAQTHVGVWNTRVSIGCQRERCKIVTLWILNTLISNLRVTAFFGGFFFKRSCLCMYMWNIFCMFVSWKNMRVCICVCLFVCVQRVCTRLWLEYFFNLWL